jgi:hypothetical protein
MTTADIPADTEVFAPPPGAFRKTKWSVVWLLTLTIFAALTVGGLLAPIQEAVKLDLGLSDFQLAMIVGSATAIPDRHLVPAHRVDGGPPHPRTAADHSRLASGRSEP